MTGDAILELERMVAEKSKPHVVYSDADLTIIVVGGKVKRISHPQIPKPSLFYSFESFVDYVTGSGGAVWYDDSTASHYLYPEPRKRILTATIDLDRIKKDHNEAVLALTDKLRGVVTLYHGVAEGP